MTIAAREYEGTGKDRRTSRVPCVLWFAFLTAEIAENARKVTDFELIIDSGLI
jgi:hypothetical protein